MRLPEIETHVIATPAAPPYMRARHKSEQLNVRVLGRRRRIDKCRTADKARDPKMHQTKKGNQWYFGMKAHFGVDSRTKLIHPVVATPTNVAESTVLPDLLHGQETHVWGDQAYRSQRAVIRQQAPKAQGFVNRRYRHRWVVDEVEREKSYQVQSAGQGRTFDRGYQAGVRRCQSALSRAEEEHSSPARDLRAGRAGISCAANRRSVSGTWPATPCGPQFGAKTDPITPLPRR